MTDNQFPIQAQQFLCEHSSAPLTSEEVHQLWRLTFPEKAAEWDAMLARLDAQEERKIKKVSKFTKSDLAFLKAMHIVEEGL